MTKVIKLYGGIIGSAIIVPASIVAVAGFAIALAFDKSSGSKIDIGVILSVIAMILSLSTPALTVVNYVKPENEFKKISAILIIIAGLISTISVLYTVSEGFNIIQILVLFGAVSILASGVLQLKE
jgi:hypothetical protein